MKLKVLLLAALLFAQIYSIAQSTNTVNVGKNLNTIAEPVGLTSPNAASLGAYGDIPVSLYTGIPAINVPLHSLSVGRHSLPISLSYHAAGFQPDEHPGWVGMGWSLQAGGVINRTVRDMPDDYGNFNYKSTGFVIQRAGFYYNHACLQDIVCPRNRLTDPCGPTRPYGSTAYMETIARDTRVFFLDTEPDEFSFNFSGYSGKFYISTNLSTGAREWKVKCDKPMRVSFAAADTLAPPFVPTGVAANRGEYYSKSFGRFTLTAQDGTQFIFGGTTNAIEYSIGFFSQREEEWVANSWYLTKVIYPTGQEVNFTYARDNFISRMYLFMHHELRNQYSGSGFQPYSLDLDCERQPTDPHDPIQRGFSGKLISPVYLTSIQTPTTTARFIRSNTRELRVAQTFYSYKWCESTTSIGNCLPFLQGGNYALAPDAGSKSYPECLDRLQWKKLDQIQIEDVRGTIRKSFVLGYNDNDENINRLAERLTLLSVTERGEDGTIKPPYQFAYYENNQNLPGYIANQNDHWGYFNARTMATVASPWFNGAQIIDYANYSASREPAASAATYLKGMLVKIIYPTSGCTTFEYEQHAYAKQVQKDRTLFQPVTTRPAGGLRIRWIRNYTAANPTSTTQPASAREYLYVHDFTSANPAGGTSSGILGGQIEYEYAAYNVQAYGTSGTYTRRIFSSQSGLPSYNAQGSHVGYTAVVEKRSDGSFIKHWFSNFDNGHADESATATETLQPTRTAYEPYSSKEQERGLLIKEEQYTNTGVCVKRRSIRYEPLNQTRDYVRAMKAGSFLVCDNGSSTNTVAEATVYKNYTYAYLPISERETLINANGLDSLPVVKQFVYDNQKLLIEERTTDSKNQELLKTYKYPHSFMYGSSLLAGTVSSDMRTMLPMDRHMLAYPVETKTLRNGKIIEARVNTYKFVNAGSKIQPYQVFGLETREPLDPSTSYVAPTFSNGVPTLDNNLKLESAVTAYDEKGNWLSISKEHSFITSYLWDYNKTLPVAEVQNAVPERIAYTSFEADSPGSLSNNNTVFTPVGPNGWAYDPRQGTTTHLQQGGGVTGRAYYRLDQGWGVSRSNIPSGEYELTFWLQGDRYRVWIFLNTNDQELSRTEGLPNANGYRLVRARIRINNPMGSVNVDANAVPVNIDEVRLCPVGTRMKTFTHDPILGVTTLADENSLPTYYEYDGLQRLNLIKDWRGNIIKHLEYHYQQ